MFILAVWGGFNADLGFMSGSIGDLYYILESGWMLRVWIRVA